MSTKTGYEAWRDAAGGGSLEDQAILVTLDAELGNPDRVPASFAELVGTIDTACAGMSADDITPRETLDRAISGWEETDRSQLIPFDEKERARIGPEVVWHVDLATVRRRKYSTNPIKKKAPPKAFTMNRGPGVNERGQTAVSSSWVSFDSAERGPLAELSPTEARCRLGTAHWEEGAPVYRVSFPTDQLTLFIPTALDTKFFPPFHPPPMDCGEPWGLTRDLRDNSPALPELLADTGATATMKQRAVALPLSSSTVAVIDKTDDRYLEEKVKDL